MLDPQKLGNFTDSDQLKLYWEVENISGPITPQKQQGLTNGCRLGKNYVGRILSTTMGLINIGNEHSLPRLQPTRTLGPSTKIWRSHCHESAQKLQGCNNQISVEFSQLTLFNINE